MLLLLSVDLKRLETSIVATLRRAPGYPEPNDEGGEFDPIKLTSSYLNKLDTNKRNKMIAGMTGLLWYRSLPLSPSKTVNETSRKEERKE